MANSDKNILITPNKGSSNQPQIVFTGAGNVPVSLKVLDDLNGTISFFNQTNQKLFSISGNDDEKTIFSINDSLNRPSIDITNNGDIRLTPFGGRTDIGGSGIVLPKRSTTSLGSPEEGLIVYDADEKVIKIGNGESWVDLSYSIVREGLVGYWDAANPSSYPRSGSTLYDLSGFGNNGTLSSTTGVTFQDEFYGVLKFDGNSSVDIPGINLTYNAVDGYTVIGAARYAPSASFTGRMINGLNNNWLMGHWGSSAENYYALGWVTPVGNGPNDSNWRLYAATGSHLEDVYAFTTREGRYFVSNNGGSTGPDGLRLGRYGLGNEYSDGQFSFVLCYNRVLSPSEITKCFNAFRYRFLPGFSEFV